MTRVTRDRVLKDVNGNISDHLRNHIHLTNCIHLKNMHKHSPLLADKSLMRELVVLQRSRSLRDPSTSPPSWQSPSVIDLLLKRGEKEAAMGNGRRSIGIEHLRDVRGMVGSSPSVAGQPHAKVTPGDVSRNRDGAPTVSDCSSKSGAHAHRRVKREKSSGRNLGTELMSGKNEPEVAGDADNMAYGVVSGSSGMKDKNVRRKESQKQDDHIKTLSEQLNEVRGDSDDAASSHAQVQGRHFQTEKFAEGATEVPKHGFSSGLNRGKRRKFHSTRRNRASVGSRHAIGQSEMSVASNSLAQGAMDQKYHVGEEDEEYTEQNFTRAPRNGCGIPWNWSRIHDRGKSFLDMAGRSFSCGLSDSRLKKGGSVPRGSDIPDMPIMSGQSSSSTRSDAEALPLLLEASGSQGSTDNAAWFHDYSGELGIFADNLLKHELDSDLASEARSGEEHKARGLRNRRHQNLTQKYMPRTFRDLVGQNLVARALSNAVVKRKVGLLYVFYGPHGTGKTSTARIFARALNCQSLEHPKPCGFCNSCIAHDTGKSRNIKEIGPVSNFESIVDLLDNMIVSQLASQYRVSIFDDCDTLSPECWSAIVKVIDRAPRRVVFVLVCSSLDVLPHIIISRCQKFFFPKLKDADIIYTLQWIASKEYIEIDKDALKLIASKSDGSLRDAEMTLEQLSLLGQKISVPLVQEMVGLISDEKLVDLLDLALSADTVNTVKNLRETMESGVEPLALMSQLATVITDILAGGFDFRREGPRRKFFRRQPLLKEDMEKLRQALKTLSEAEKQLRMSNDRLTWLTAALLQLAPDQQYILPSSSAETSFNHSPLPLNSAGKWDRPRKSSAEHTEVPNNNKGLSSRVRIDNVQSGNSGDASHGGMVRGANVERRRHAAVSTVSQQSHNSVDERNRVGSGQLPSKFHREIEQIWLEVLAKIQVNGIREFLLQEGKLISVGFGAAPTAQLVFSSHLAKSKAEKFKAQILRAFESVLGSPVTIEIRCQSSKDVRAGPIILPAASHLGSSHKEINPGFISSNQIPVEGYDDRGAHKDRDTLSELQLNSAGACRTEIVELEASPKELKANKHIQSDVQFDRKNAESSLGGGATYANGTVIPDRRKLGDRNQSLSLVRGKVSLAHVIQQAEGCALQSGWSKHKAVSIAEKLEQENLRMEPRSRSLLCWKASRVTRRKLSRLKVRTRKPQTLLKFVSCGKCLSGRSPRSH